MGVPSSMTPINMSAVMPGILSRAKLAMRKSVRVAVSSAVAVEGGAVAEPAVDDACAICIGIGGSSSSSLSSSLPLCLCLCALAALATRRSMANVRDVACESVTCVVSDVDVAVDVDVDVEAHTTSTSTWGRT